MFVAIIVNMTYKGGIDRPFGGRSRVQRPVSIRSDKLEARLIILSYLKGTSFQDQQKTQLNYNF